MPTFPCCAAPPIQNFEAVSLGVVMTNSLDCSSYEACNAVLLANASASHGCSIQVTQDKDLSRGGYDTHLRLYSHNIRAVSKLGHPAPMDCNSSCVNFLETAYYSLSVPQHTLICIRSMHCKTEWPLSAYPKQPGRSKVSILGSHSSWCF